MRLMEAYVTLRRKEQSGWRRAQREGSRHETHVACAASSLAVALPSRAAWKSFRNSSTYSVVDPEVHLQTGTHSVYGGHFTRPGTPDMGETAHQRGNGLRQRFLAIGRLIAQRLQVHPAQVRKLLQV